MIRLKGETAGDLELVYTHAQKLHPIVMARTQAGVVVRFARCVACGPERSVCFVQISPCALLNLSIVPPTVCQICPRAPGHQQGQHFVSMVGEIAQERMREMMEIVRDIPMPSP